MAQYNIVLVLLTFFNTLFLVAGISIVYATTKFDICSEEFYYAIRDFILLYQVIFFAYGLLLIVLSVFGFIAMFLESKIMLDTFGKLLFTLLLLLLLIFCVSIWGKGPKYLRSTMFNAFNSYNMRGCRLDMSIDALQSKFYCCGIEGPKDWDAIRVYQKNNNSLEPPLSCCDPSLTYEEHDILKCMAFYESGCYEPVLRYISRAIHIIDAIGIGIALSVAFGIICAFQFINILKKGIFTSQTQPILEVNVPDAQPILRPVMLSLYQNESIAKSAHSSSVV